VINAPSTIIVSSREHTHHDADLDAEQGSVDPVALFSGLSEPVGDAQGRLVELFQTSRLEAAVVWSTGELCRTDTLAVAAAVKARDAIERLRTDPDLGAAGTAGRGLRWVVEVHSAHGYSLRSRS